MQTHVELARVWRRLQLLALRGTGRWQGDLDRLRAARTGGVSGAG